jgi:hypothetical protein
MVYLLVFRTYINEMHVSRSKIPSKNSLVRQRCAEGFNSGVKGLMIHILDCSCNRQAHMKHENWLFNFLFYYFVLIFWFVCYSLYT